MLDLGFWIGLGRGRWFLADLTILDQIESDLIELYRISYNLKTAYGVQNRLR